MKIVRPLPPKPPGMAKSTYLITAVASVFIGAQIWHPLLETYWARKDQEEQESLKKS